jgi:hypothetical protein
MLDESLQLSWEGVLHIVNLNTKNFVSSSTMPTGSYSLPEGVLMSLKIRCQIERIKHLYFYDSSWAYIITTARVSLP